MIPSGDAVLQQAEEIKISESWFKVLRLPNDVFSIHEHRHQQGVISFLILGTKKSNLFDTGMGIRDISTIIDQLTDLEVMVVYSRTHLDQIGDNHCFSNIFVYDDVSLESIIPGIPEGFVPQSCDFKPVDRERISFSHENDVIDIGDRPLQVLHTPDQSPDSIMLLDNLNRSLFTGDTFYPDWLFAFIGEEWGGSDLMVYAKTIQELTRLVPKLNYLFCTHSKALR